MNFEKTLKLTSQPNSITLYTLYMSTALYSFYIQFLPDNILLFKRDENTTVTFPIFINSF